MNDSPRRVAHVEVQPGFFVVSAPGSAPEGAEVRQRMHTIMTEVRAAISSRGLTEVYAEALGPRQAPK